MGSHFTNCGPNFRKDCLPAEFNGSLPKFDGSFNIQSLREAIEKRYPPCNTSPSPDANHIAKSNSTKLSVRSMSDDTQTNSTVENKLHRSLSLPKIDEYHDAVNYQFPATPLQ